MKRQLSIDFEAKPERLLSPDDVMEHADVETVRKLIESRVIERKPANYGGDNLGNYISMWANTWPDGGIVASGVLDDGSFEGCLKLSQKRVNELEKTRDTFCPDARVKVKQLQVRNLCGEPDFILLTRVYYHTDKVVKIVAGRAFVRRGDSKFELKADEIRELQADKGEVSFEQQKCGLKYPDDFNQAEIIAFVARVRKARKIPESHTTEEVLVARHLGIRVNDSFVPNYACLLLFGKDPLRIIPGCKIRFQKFDGEHERTGDKYNVVKDVVVEGCVPKLIEQLDALLESQLRTFSPLDDKGKFFPLPEYPWEAWYEAVVNACVHRSYGNGMKNMPVFVKLFDDRLVIESPGPFPPFVNSDNIYDMHTPRNPQLMDALFYLDYVKCAHEGTRRIRDTMLSMALPNPEFKQAEIGHSLVRVTLRNDIKQRRVWVDRDVSSLISEAIAADLTEDEKRVLNWAADHGKVTISDADKLLDTSWQGARKILLGLAKKRIFQYIRFVSFEKDSRDPRAYFRLRSNDPLPDGAFEQKSFEKAAERPKTKKSK